MNKNLVVGGGVLAAIVASVIFYFSLDQRQIEEITPTDETPLTESPIVHVTSEGVVVIKDGNEREVVDGESILPPYELKSGATGKAVVRFSEGSELRLDPNSNLIVESAAYTPESKNLFVQVKLTVGRLWSDITLLATPESAWEVETSNVVATVRGSSFGVIAEENGTTTVIGSEHDIDLTIIDPDTGERKETRKVTLHEDEVVVISDEEAKNDDGPAPKTHKKTDTEKNDPWLLMQEKQDAENLEDLLNDSEENDARDPETEVEEEAEAEETIDTRATPPAVVTPREEPRTTPTPTPAPSSASKKANSVTITSATTLNGVTEGTPVRLTATLIYSDGSKKDVTGEVTWKVLGNVGSISGGVFNPLLNESVAEYGHAPGSITATWKDAGTGESLLGSTPIFDVKARVSESNGNEQG